MSNSLTSFEPLVPAFNSQGGCIITLPNANPGKSVIFSNSGDSGDMTGPEISVLPDNKGVRGGNDGGQSASQNGMD